MHESEKYLPIEGFPDYLITSQGRVLSLKYGKMIELKQHKNNWGYYYVTLSKNGKLYSKTVHRLVAQAFIPNPDNKPQVNHIDEDISNNHVSNLEWATARENLNHGTRNERASNSVRGEKNPKAKSVIGFKINGCDMKYYKFIKESEKDGFNPNCISLCCRKINKSHKGFEWFYADEYFNRKDDNL